MLLFSYQRRKQESFSAFSVKTRWIKRRGKNHGLSNKIVETTKKRYPKGRFILPEYRSSVVFHPCFYPLIFSANRVSQRGSNKCDTEGIHDSC